MKTNKIIIQICLMLACVLLQAHIILPHFHHDGIVCITKESNADCSGCHSKGNHNHSDKHCSDTIDECDLKQIILRQSDPDDEFNTHYPINLFSLYSLLYPLSSLYPQFADLATEYDTTPYLNFYTSPFTGSVKSLRAPPVSSFVG